MSLVTALATSPKLRVVRTQLPVVWNPALLAISHNPSLEKVELWNAFQSQGDAIVGTGLFLTEARRNKRLVDLIRAGTLVQFYCCPDYYRDCFKFMAYWNLRVLHFSYFDRHIIRTRAHTIGTCRPPVSHLEDDPDFFSLSCFLPSTSLPHLDLC